MVGNFECTMIKSTMQTGMLKTNRAVILKTYLKDECIGLRDTSEASARKWTELLSRVPAGLSSIATPTKLIDHLERNLHEGSYEDWLPLARYLMVECRQFPEPTWAELEKNSQRQWYIEEILTDMLWTCEKGVPGSEAYIKFRTPPIMNSLKLFGQWLIEERSLIETNSAFDDIRGYVPRLMQQDLSNYRGIAIHYPYSCRQELTYRLVQGSHRLFQSIYQGYTAITCFTVCSIDNCTVHRS